jgi:hypothetical protein
MNLRHIKMVFLKMQVKLIILIIMFQFMVGDRHKKIKNIGLFKIHMGLIGEKRAILK